MAGLEPDGPRCHEEHAFRFDRHGEDTGFVASFQGERLSFCYVALCYWPTFERDVHEDDVWTRERDAFDRVFELALEEGVARVGTPSDQWEELHADAGAMRTATWQAWGGTLVLQQAEYDGEFGVEVNWWWSPNVKDVASHTRPFVDWLERASRFGDSD
ncbi:MAG: hypothetical protein KC586_14755 [Myxococcales bacterium]|nr:hypothetical protein [Myxococcales bacterium]